MSNETSKSRARRTTEGYYSTIFQGRGIDIGCGDDPVTPTCLRWDRPQGDAHDLAGLAPASFDWVYSSHCLEHLEDPRRALRRWWDVLKPGGKMLLVVPDEDLYEQGHWPSLYNDEHKSTFTIHKSASWSPVSLNLTDLLSELPHHKVGWIRTCDYNYDYLGGIWDRTQGAAEAQIELFVEKMYSVKHTPSAAQMLLEGREQPGDQTLYLDDLACEADSVGWGTLGRHGDLGWDGLRVVVEGRTFDHALSAHAPSSLIFDLNEQYDLFRCQVALNHTAIGADVTFQVLTDGIVAASVEHVRDFKVRELTVCMRGVHKLELRVTCGRFEACQSVWLNPTVEVWPEEGILDPLKQVRIFHPAELIVAEKCIVTMASAGYDRWLDIFLTSLRRNGNCADAEIVVFRVGEDAACDAVISRHGAHTVPCHSLVPMSSTIRPAVFCLGSVARVKKALIAEIDMIVLQDISALWDAMDVCADPFLLVGREQNRDYGYPLEEFFGDVFQGTGEELIQFGVTKQERIYDLQINGGLIGGTGAAIVALDSTMRGCLPFSREWVQQRPDIRCREMFVINLAMARLNNVMRIQPAYNAQTYRGSEYVRRDQIPPLVEFRNAPVKILHFCDRKADHGALQSYYWEYKNPDNKLADGLARVRTAPLEQLREPNFVADLIREIGVQEPFSGDATLIYGDDVAYMNPGAGLFQIPMQLAQVLVYLSDKQIRTYAEVGIYRGWTFAFITAYLDRFTSIERSIAIDSEDVFTTFFHVREHYPIEFVQGTSAALEGQPFDLVFIDADHSYGPTRQDYLSLGRFGRFCMFHDIDDFQVEHYGGGETVKRLWGELREENPQTHKEFLDHSRNAQVMGIGLLSRPPR
jgi:SAM-dependent methyltransferase